MSKERVVYIGSPIGEIIPENPMPVKGEIYTVVGHRKYLGHDYLYLDEITEKGVFFIACAFRPVDDSFGEYIESTLMKDIELETVLNEISL